MRTCLAAPLLLIACARTPENPLANPPPAFIEAEPERTDARWRRGLTVAFGEDLLIDAHAEPLELGRGTWGVRIELEFYNRGAGTFDLGDEPLLLLQVAVTRPDNSGFGSGGGCGFSSGTHGFKARPLAPGERYGARQDWSASVGPGELLEMGVELCGIVAPDGRRRGGELVRVHARVRPDGQLDSFELLPSSRSNAQ